jgi:hypothetical protein
LLNSLDTTLAVPQTVAAGTTVAATATTTATTTAATNADATEATSTVNAQAIMQPVTIDPLVLTAVAAYRAGEVIATAPADRPLKNPEVDMNPDIDRIPKVDPINSNSNSGANQEDQNPAHATVTPVSKVEFKVEAPLIHESTGVDVSV